MHNYSCVLDDIACDDPRPASSRSRKKAVVTENPGVRGGRSVSFDNRSPTLRSACNASILFWETNLSVSASTAIFFGGECAGHLSCTNPTIAGIVRSRKFRSDAALTSACRTGSLMMPRLAARRNAIRRSTSDCVSAGEPTSAGPCNTATASSGAYWYRRYQRKISPIPTIPYCQSSAARRAPMLAAPNTGIPCAIVQRISLWRTAGSPWNTPSMSRIAGGLLCCTAETKEPCAAGGRYSASRTVAASEK